MHRRVKTRMRIAGDGRYYLLSHVRNLPPGRILNNRANFWVRRGNAQGLQLKMPTTVTLAIDTAIGESHTDSGGFGARRLQSVHPGLRIRSI